MNLKELKNKILNNNLNDSCIVFKCLENNFLAMQYINKISKIKDLNIMYLESLKGIESSFNDIFNTMNNYLYVLIVDKFIESNHDYTKLKNTIIVCKSIDDSINIPEEFIIEIPKLEEWQILDYMKESCKGLNSDEINWLFNETKGDIYRIENELNKINLFPQESQEQVFLELNSNGGYSDLSSLNIFNFSNAIIKKDIDTIKKVLIEFNNIDIEGTGLITILHKNFKNIINIKMNQKATPESLKMTPKQFKAIEYSGNKYSNEKLMKIFKFITSFDFILKSGKLEFKNDRLVDYILCHVL